jgi:hypothetical protein
VQAHQLFGAALMIYSVQSEKPPCKVASRCGELCSDIIAWSVLRMQKRDARVLQLAKQFLKTLRGHSDRYEALEALTIAKTLFVHPVIEGKES